MLEKHNEKFVGDIVVGGDAGVFFTEVMAKLRFKIYRPGSKDHLMAIYRLALNHQGDVRELFLIKKS
jgi:hypothetical protein